MAPLLSWQLNEQVLSLKGELNSETLLLLWEARQPLLSQVTTFDFSGLSRIDTAGLALLVYFIGQVKQQRNHVELRQVSENLHSLVQLYNLPESLFPRCSA